MWQGDVYEGLKLKILDHNCIALAETLMTVKQFICSKQSTSQIP